MQQINQYCVPRFRALDVYPTNAYWSNGTTSTDGTTDNNVDPEDEDIRLLDVGYHYRGWDSLE